MRVGVGFSENPDTILAGKEAAEQALKQSGMNSPCNLVLLFSTARHDAPLLRATIASVVGTDVPIVGGGAVGAITNDYYGYAGDQIIVGLFWLQGVNCDIITQGELTDGEKEAGYKLGQKLAENNVNPDSSILFFYDAIDRTEGHVKLTMATPLLQGIEQSLGFLPRLVGAGLQGDYLLSPFKQWTGRGMAEHSALALHFTGNLFIDSVIMHGCRPATSYHTVTKADNQTILEIDGEPALQFVDKVLNHTIPQESYPFFLVLGVNKGDKWGVFDEEAYAGRLCFAIDKERNGIVMFEPDMVEGTEFQFMHRSMDLDYMPPRIEMLFNRLDGRKPVFGLYIDCAGRAAGHAGIDLEDAVVVQKCVAERVPLMGIYTGVEIGMVNGSPRGLDWTGIFCLFSVPDNEKK